ncbi:MAG: deoxynucleoside kinase [Gammaproteobacteria bacterium]|jgi:deoxyadenosine/deoxycytidine kinase|nr:deoxynucleoside kinase [Gammaproteobacteria bacterium]
MANSRYIAIEGPIGVGKTSLARRLAAELDGELVLEEAGANPFLERFYDDPRGAALPAQLFFLFQRARQMDLLGQADLFSELRVSDFLMAKDRLFAEVTLDRDEFALYQQIFASLNLQPPVPDLVVFLQAPVDTLLYRIAQRGIAYEQIIKRRYLERLADAYSRFFHQYTESPLLIVNASTIDPVNNERHFQMLLEEIDSARSGRQFFNPLVSALA